MGYASTIPSGLTQSCASSTFVNFIDVTVVQADKTITSVSTPNYKQPLALAYARVVIDHSVDSSGALNYINTTGLPYLALNDGSGAFDAGLLPFNYHCYTLANSVSFNMVIQLGTDITSYLAPNTTYTAVLKNMTAVGNNLRLYHPHVEIDLYFGM